MHKLKKWLWPHRSNNFHPHLIRPLGLGLVVAVLMTVNATYNYTTARTLQVLGYATNISAGEIIGLSNQQRTSRGLGAYGTNAKLNQAAQAKAQDMINRNYWSHYAPDGTSPWYFIGNAGYSYTTAGENLAKDFDTSAGVVNAWMNSAAHRDNILSGQFVETGVAAVNGVLNGQQTTVVVAMYATPKAAAPAPAPAPAPAAPAPTTTQPKSTTPAPQATAPAETAPPPAAPVTEPQPATETKPTNNTVTTTPSESAGPTKEQIQGVTLAAETEKSFAVREQMNWARSVAMFMLSVLLFVTILKHTVVWRTQRRGWRHVWMRAHPAAQYGLIILALIVNFSTTVGVIR